MSVENCRYGKAKGKRQEARVKRVWAILHFFTQFSFIVFTYLIVGCANKIELQTLEKFLRQFDVIRIDQPISDKAVDLLRLYRLSHGLLIADGLIAATAIICDCPFITKNQRDYRFIQNLNLLPYP